MAPVAALDHFVDLSAYDGRRLVMLVPDHDQLGREAVRLQVVDFGSKGANVACATIVPERVDLATFVAACRPVWGASRIEGAVDAAAEALLRAAADVRVHGVDVEVRRLLWRLGRRALARAGARWRMAPYILATAIAWASVAGLAAHGLPWPLVAALVPVAAGTTWMSWACCAVIAQDSG